MGTHIVYAIARNGARYASEFMPREQAARLEKEIRDNGGTAEAFPADDRPKLFAWGNPSFAPVYRIRNGMACGLRGPVERVSQ